LPEGWRPDAEDVQFARKAGVPDPMRAAAKFSAWHRSEGTERADWRAAWQRWCLDEPRFQDAGGSRPELTNWPPGKHNGTNQERRDGLSLESHRFLVLRRSGRLLEPMTGISCFP
jgi:hypothetical protein